MVCGCERFWGRVGGEESFESGPGVTAFGAVEEVAGYEQLEGGVAVVVLQEGEVAVCGWGEGLRGDAGWGWAGGFGL